MKKPYDAEDARFFSFCLCLFLGVSIATCSSGIYLIGNGRDSDTGMRMEHLGKVIREWNETYLGEFEAADFSLKRGAPTEYEIEIPMD
jgi:hypothetical protein